MLLLSARLHIHSCKRYLVSISSRQKLRGPPGVLIFSEQVIFMRLDRCEMHRPRSQVYPWKQLIVSLRLATQRES
jgi:hypothetical protein